MGWLCGIPDFEMAQNFVYFEDLRIKRENNSHIGYQRKLNLYNAAASAINRSIMELDEPQRIQQATDFIKQIAERERTKEIKFVQDYCIKNKKRFPNLTKLLKTNWILNNPDEFYVELTKALNKARQDQNDFMRALQRIKDNINPEKFKKDNRAEYSADNYIYRLDSDIRSMINKFIGIRRAAVNDEALATKLHEAVIEIIDKLDISVKISEGISFLAIATAILSDLENRLQKEYDKLRNKKEDKLEDIDLDAIKNKYLEELESQSGLTEIQRAINQIGGREYQNIIKNFTNQFGASYVTETSELDKRLKEVQSIANKTKYSKKKLNTTQHMNKIKATINKSSTKLIEQLNKIKITSVNKTTAHGNIAEWLSSILQNKLSTSRTIGGIGLADDIIQMKLNVEIGSNVDKTEIDKLADEMVNLYQEMIDPNFVKGKAHKQSEHDAQMYKLTQLNNSIDKVMKKLNEKIKELDDDLQLFVFHDSLKEYSSIETGKSDSFTGRTLNILSAWDEIYGALAAGGYNEPADRNTINFLSMHLSNLTVGGGAPKDILADYLSIFSGLIMFTDVQNMAKEAFNQIEYSNVNVIHAYKLNQVYVPASMILTFIADSVEQANKMIIEGAHTQVKITTNNATRAINKWLKNRSWSTNDNDESTGYNEAYDWTAVASEVASGTKVHISFMGSFLKLINKLFQS